MRAAVLGSPIAHSLSPTLHNAGYVALGLTGWRYDSFEVRREELPAFVGGLGQEWRGLSLTMPLKQACLLVADQASDLATRLGVANTLVRTSEANWRAENTDAPGLVAALSPVWDPTWQRVALLGAGGTARAALAAVAQLGVTEVNCYARNLESARGFRDWARLAVPEVRVQEVELSGWVDSDEAAVLSTLPAGAIDQVAFQRQRNGLLFDAVYAGWPTPLARAGESAGMVVVSGLDMLVHQAAIQFRLFTGHEAPIEAMFAAGRSAVAGRQS